jgi:hypothetical protein
MNKKKTKKQKVEELINPEKNKDIVEKWGDKEI